MKVSNFRKLNNNERNALRRTCERNNIKVNLNNLKVAFGTDTHKLFTYCQLKDLTNPSNEQLYVGASKRMKCDRYNKEVGEIIALRKALTD
jgi:hypothetical protein